jgi:hypothetical protein
MSGTEKATSSLIKKLSGEKEHCSGINLQKMCKIKFRYDKNLAVA